MTTPDPVQHREELDDIAEEQERTRDMARRVELLRSQLEIVRQRKEQAHGG